MKRPVEILDSNDELVAVGAFSRWEYASSVARIVLARPLFAVISPWCNFQGLKGLFFGQFRAQKRPCSRNVGAIGSKVPRVGRVLC